MKKREDVGKPQMPTTGDYETASSALFRKQKRVVESGLPSAQEELEGRQRMAARNKALDLMLKILLVVLVIIAVTRVAVWLAKGF